MSAATLREAAALMRQRAEAATPGPWVALEVGTAREPGEWIVDSDTRLIAGNVGLSTDPAAQPLAEHLASWHPTVAIAFADWLEWTARSVPPDPHADSWVQCETCGNVARAVKAALAYLGRSE